MKYQSNKKPANEASRKGTRSKGKSNPLVRREVAGLLLLALGLVLFLSIISYRQSDPVGILQENNHYQVQNWLGQFGATVAAPLFQWTLGYPVLVLPFLIFLYGIYFLISRPLCDLRRFTLLLVSWAIFASVVLALPAALQSYGKMAVYYPSGFIGGILAAYSVIIFSKFGA
ncbi:MAG: DNA translocase FtsK 4TM domain-containing protein, partial [Calditrichia bacterium]